MTPSLLTALALTLGAPGPKEGPKKDPPSVVGEWITEKGVIGGNDEAIPAGGVTFAFAPDGKVRITEGAKQPAPTDYTVDPKKSPAEIDIVLVDPGRAAREMAGIYKVDGDTLTLCLNRGGSRPAKFESPAGSDVMLLTLKRAKKKD